MKIKDPQLWRLPQLQADIKCECVGTFGSRDSHHDLWQGMLCLVDKQFREVDVFSSCSSHWISSCGAFLATHIRRYLETTLSASHIFLQQSLLAFPSSEGALRSRSDQVCSTTPELHTRARFAIGSLHCQLHDLSYLHTQPSSPKSEENKEFSCWSEEMTHVFIWFCI